MSTPSTKAANKITRARAEYNLTHGADPSSDVYTKHANKHVKAKAAKMSAKLAAAAAPAA
jgi:hypothetical protein